MTRERFAAALGISRSYLSLLETGKKQPSLEVAVRIERITSGAVPASSWISHSDELPAASRRRGAA
ncbi:helix-turn-helix transcriptional regulator [Cereibacter sphaeroides]